MREEFKLHSLIFEYLNSEHFFCLYFFGQNLTDIENWVPAIVLGDSWIFSVKTFRFSFRVCAYVSQYSV